MEFLRQTTALADKQPDATHSPSFPIANLHFLISRAIDQMVVDHPSRLHERITNRRADELEAGASQGFAQRIRLRSLGGDFGQRCPGVLDRCPTDEGPQEIAERLPPGGQRQIGLGILDGGGDLGAVADDAGVGQQGGDFRVVVAGDLVRVEAVEYLPVVRPLLEHGGPRQAGLGAFEDQQFEQGAIVAQRQAPFRVMVFAVEVESFAPGAAFHCHASISKRRSVAVSAARRQPQACRSSQTCSVAGHLPRRPPETSVLASSAGS